MGHFRIQDTDFESPLDPREGSSFSIASVPRPYNVDFPENEPVATMVLHRALASKAPLLLVDRKVAKLHLDQSKELRALPCFAVDAVEENKAISTVLEIVEFLEENRATKTSMLFVVGGGIVQDLAAFSAYLYKRGLPWTFIPSTLLAQGDSSIGGKTALNHKKTKNLLALFSAPREVVIEPKFLNTLSADDVLSGMGEVFRLHVTGGEEFLTAFEREFLAFQSGSRDAIVRLIVGALSVKKAVIEKDEFELDLRRSLNYGHSFGHALEALTDYRIPHGVAVTIGMLVENEVSMRKGLLEKSQRDRLLKSGALLIPLASRDELASLKLDGVLDLLRRDKKTEGNALKLVVVESIGQLRFIDLELNPPTVTLLHDCVHAVLDSL